MAGGQAVSTPVATGYDDADGIVLDNIVIAELVVGTLVMMMMTNAMMVHVEYSNHRSFPLLT